MAKKFKVNEITVRRAKLIADIKTKKCQKAPLYKNNQEERGKTNCRKLVEKKFVRKVVIMDDETYVLNTRESTPGNKFYSFIRGQSVSPSKKFKRVEKFPKKYLVWQAIADDGKVCKPKVLKGTMGTDTYVDCLETIMIPWIKKEYGVDNVVFWPDMAACHYSKKTLALLDAHGIDYVGKLENAPNLPQGRPIEKFCALCKQQLSVDVNNVDHLEKEWKKVSRKVAKDHGHNLMKGLRSKLRTIGRQGVYAIL